MPDIFDTLEAPAQAAGGDIFDQVAVTETHGSQTPNTKNQTPRDIFDDPQVRMEAARQAGESDLLKDKALAVGEYAARAGDVFGALNYLGRVASGFVNDVSQGNVLPTPTRFFPLFPNTGSAFRNEPQPDKPKGFIPEVAVETAKALPMMGASMALQSAGVPAPAAFGVPMAGTTFEETRDPVAAAKSGVLGALMPGVGEKGAALGEKMAQQIAAKAGVNEATAQALEVLGKVTGSQSLLTALMAGAQSPELLTLAKDDPEAAKHELAKIVASNLAFEIPHLPTHVREARAVDLVDQYFKSPEYKRSMDEVAVAALSPNAELGTGNAEKRNVDAPAVELSPDVLKDLEASLRGNQLAPKAEPEKANQPEIPEAGPSAELVKEIENSVVKSRVEPVAEKKPVTEKVSVEPAEKPKDIFDEVAAVDAGAEPAKVAESGAETITGQRQKSADEQTGSEIPAEREERPNLTTLPPAETETPPAGTPSKDSQFTVTENKRPYDLIDWVADNFGTISLREIRATHPDWKPVGAVRKLFSASGSGADSAATRAHEAGIYKGEPGQVDQFADALNAAAIARKGYRTTAARENRVVREEAKQAEQFGTKVLEGRFPKKLAGKTETVRVNDLLQGDTFQVEGHKFTVKDLEIDDDGRLLSLTVKDGPKFGVQTIDPGATEIIHVDKESLKSRAKPSEEDETPFSLRPKDSPQKKTIDQRLDALKIKTDGTLHAFGLIPEIWNTLIDLVKLGVRGGRAASDAIEWAFKELRKQHPNLRFDHEGARETLAKELSFSMRGKDANRELNELQGKANPDAFDRIRIEELQRELGQEDLFSEQTRSKSAEEIENQKAIEKQRAEIARRQSKRLFGGAVESQGDIFEKPAQGSFFSTREGEATGGTRKAELEEALAPILDRWENAPLVKVVQSEADLPKDHFRRIQSAGAEGRVEGYYDAQSGRVFLVADNLPDAARARAVLFHEVIGHHGLRAVLGKEFTVFLREVFSKYVDSDAARDVAHDYDLDPTDRVDQLVIADEILARMAEGKVEDVALWRRVVARVRKWLRSVGLGNEISEDEIRSALAQSRRRVESAGSRPRGDKGERLSVTPKEDSAPEPPRDWEALKAKVEAAAERLRETIAAAADRRARPDKSRREAIAEKNIATAQYRRLRDELLHHPGYARDLLQLHAEGTKALREAKAAGDHERVAKIEFALNEWQQEMAEMPPKLLNKVHEELFGKSETEPQKESGKEVAASGLSERAEDQVESLPEDNYKRAVAELPDKAREVFKLAKETKGKLAAMMQRSPNLDIISYTKDAADNRAGLFGRQAANVILHELNRAFGEKDVNNRNQMREWALTFMIEGNRSRDELMDFKQIIETSEHRNGVWAKRGIAAIDYALKHFERLEKPAEIYGQLTDAQQAAEQNSGIATLHRDGGYVFHLQDIMEHWALPDVGGGGGGAAAPFKHIRDFPTYAQAIAAGTNPKSLNAVDLMHRRMTLGRKLINYKAWIDSMSDLVDPSTMLPLVTAPVIRARADGSMDTTAPAGYALENFAGNQVAIHKGYQGIFTAVTGESWFGQGSVRPLMMKAAGTSKHLMLIFDSYHLGRLAFWNAMGRGMNDSIAGGFLPGNPAAYKKGVTLLDNTEADIRQMAKNGEIPADWVDGLVEQRKDLDGLLRAGLNVGNVADNIHSDWIKNLPVAGKFSKWLFDQYQRGAMAEVGLMELARQRKMNPNRSDAELWRAVARDVNIRFGNLNSQSWVKSKTGQDLARMIFLAPQWNESLIRSELGAVRELLQAPVDTVKNRRLTVGLLGRTVATAVLGTFISNQLINWYTRGQPTWDNKEEGAGAKVSAYIPDVVGNSSGFFLNPFVLPTEISHLMLEKTERTGDVSKAYKEFIGSRLNSGTRALVWTPLIREDELGSKLRDAKEVGTQIGKTLIPVPLSAGTIYRGAKQLVTGEHEEKFPGQFEKQTFQTFGVKMANAPGPEQRMRALAAEFNREKGIKPGADFYHGDFYDLDRAALVDNKREMAKALEEVLQKKTRSDIFKHYDRWARAPYTGQAHRESEFKATLTEEQRESYDESRRKRRELVERVKKLLREMPK